MKTYYIHPAAFGSTDPGYGHVPVVKADEAEKRVAELEVVKELFLRAKALMYQSGGTPIENSLNPIDAWLYDAERAAAMLQGAEPVTTAYKLQEETGSSLQLRYLIRQHHAEWSQATFGDVGPIGPLKHLSKEALEAAAEPDDLSEWADMQFLLWDAQRRAGISDGEITAAMEEKLKVNMARQWPEPKDGEPRLHIKAAPQQEVKA